MLTNLQQLPAWAWLLAVLVIVAASAMVIWARKRKFTVSKIKLTAGPVEAELTPASPEKGAPAVLTPATSVQPDSISIRGNKIIGWNSFRIRRLGTKVEDNLIAGQNEIEVGDKPGPKPKKGTSRR